MSQFNIQKKWDLNYFWSQYSVMWCRVLWRDISFSHHWPFSTFKPLTQINIDTKRKNSHEKMMNEKVGSLPSLLAFTHSALLWVCNMSRSLFKNVDTFKSDLKPELCRNCYRNVTISQVKCTEKKSNRIFWIIVKCMFLMDRCLSLFQIAGISCHCYHTVSFDYYYAALTLVLR